MLRLRTLLVLALAVSVAEVSAQADPDAAPPSERVAYVPVALLPLSDVTPPGAVVLPPMVAPPPAPEAPPSAVPEVVGDDLIATVVEEPAPVEDSTQLRALRAPVRMELAQARRQVVLLPGVSQREPVPPSASAPVPEGSGHVVYSRAIVVVGEGGRREVRYVDARPAALDLGAPTPGCGEGALDIGMRLRGVRATPLRLGMRGDAVRAVQHLLCAAGHATEADGVFDREMDRAVRDFQRFHNASGPAEVLAVDGAVGPRTRRALEIAIASRNAD